MVARTVAQRAAIDLSETGEHGHLFAERLQRLHGGSEFETCSLGFRNPLVENHADRMEDESEADYRCGFGGAGQRRNHGIEQRQGQGGAKATQNCAAV